MKKLIIPVTLALVLLATLGSSVVSANQATTGNGAPSGAHYNLNIIGMQNDKLKDGSGGNRIFVPLNTTGRTSKTGLANSSDILLQGGSDFYVVDNNAIDADNSATFQMPMDVATAYTVWIVGLGKPGGTANMQLWAWDPVNSVWVYNTNIVTINAHNPQKFVNVTSDLLTLGDGTNVFDSTYQDYLWTYSNNNQKLVQLRFYPVVP